MDLIVKLIEVYLKQRNMETEMEKANIQENDWLDNELLFPLQANCGKPSYELISDELIL